MADQATQCATVEEVLTVARNQIAESHQVLDGVKVPEKVKQECSIDLAHKGLSSLPEELIDIIKDEASRLALNHNHLSGLSAIGMRFSECTRLRYLVLRQNELRVFPEPILSVPTLECLDLRNNKIETLPEDLSRLQKLKVFSIRQNKITRLPVCIGNMSNLVRLTTYKNPIAFPPRELWVAQEDEHETDDDDGERRDRRREETETKKLKHVLVSYQHQARNMIETESHISESSVETPRPARRRTTGRFPIKPSVSGIDFSSVTTPVSPAPPPVPSRSNSRPPPQPRPDVAAVRPNPSPLITNLSERNRSNSESQMATTLQNKRNGFAMRKFTDAERLDAKKTHRLSQHNRGLSHGSALNNGTVSDSIDDSSNSMSPIDAESRRAAFVRRLSNLPENGRKARIPDPSVELARGIVYSMDQIHIPIKYLANAVRYSPMERSNLEQTCYIAFSFVEELDRKLAKFGTQDDEAEEIEHQKSISSIRASSETCVKAYEQLMTTLYREARTLVKLGNPQYVRTLMHLLYASLIEVRNACSKAGIDPQPTLRPRRRDASGGRYASSPSGRPATSLRMRPRTPLQNGGQSTSRNQPSAPPKPLPFNAGNRSASAAQLSAGMPQSGGSFTPFGLSVSLARSNTLLSLDETGEDKQFETIFFKFAAACEKALSALPTCSYLFSEARQTAVNSQTAESTVVVYESLYDKCKAAIDAAKSLQSRLGTLQVRDPGVRSQRDFWQLCTDFTRAFYILALQVKELTPFGLISEEVRPLLRPVQSTVKEASKAINDSPWAFLTAVSQQNSNHHHPSQHPILTLQTGTFVPPPNPLDPLSAVSNHSHSGTSSGYVTPLPATPLSAALGPAALATVPSVPNGVPQLPPTGYFSGAILNGAGMERTMSASRRNMM